MSENIQEWEPAVRFGTFLFLLLTFGCLEALFPRRARGQSRKLRWPNNFGLAMLNGILMRLLLPAGTLMFATIAETRGWGLFNTLDWPALPETALAVVLLDLGIYGQHVLFHRVPLFWRLHRVHHTDVDMDVTTGSRFHPVEIICSLGIKFLLIAALGAPLSSVLLFEVLLSSTSLFNHSNLRLPESLEPLIRRLIVTPDMHRIHHSARRCETDSNYGFNLPWWDRLFRTYRPDPAGGHLGMKTGLDEFREPAEQRIASLLAQPFRTNGKTDG